MEQPKESTPLLVGTSGYSTWIPGLRVRTRATACLLAVGAALIGLATREALNSSLPVALHAISISVNEGWVKGQLTGVGDVGYVLGKLTVVLLSARLGGRALLSASLLGGGMASMAFARGGMLSPRLVMPLAWFVGKYSISLTWGSGMQILAGWVDHDVIGRTLGLGIALFVDLTAAWVSLLYGAVLDAHRDGDSAGWEAIFMLSGAVAVAVGTCVACLTRPTAESAGFAPPESGRELPARHAVPAAPMDAKALAAATDHGGTSGSHRRALTTHAGSPTHGSSPTHHLAGAGLVEAVMAFVLSGRFWCCTLASVGYTCAYGILGNYGAAAVSNPTRARLPIGPTLRLTITVLQPPLRSSSSPHPPPTQPPAPPPTPPATPPPTHPSPLLLAPQATPS